MTEININDFKTSKATRHFDKLSVDYKEGQLRALNTLLDWTEGKINSQYYVLEGAAGTGKTTILKDFIKFCKWSSGVAVSAPTHKAKMVISNMVGLSGFTIQKLLGLRPNLELENFNINSPQYDPKGNKYISEFRLLIIDEAPMLNSGLVELILREARQHNTLILFVGDPQQLPPVGESESKIFQTDKKFVLDEIVRQDVDNPMLKVLPKLRDDITNDTKTFLSHIKGKKQDMFEHMGYEAYYVSIKSDVAEFNKKLIDSFNNKRFGANISYCRYTAYTNKNILNYNTALRKQLLKEDAIITERDIITSYSTIVDDFNRPKIVNSEDYKVHEALPYVNAFGIKGFIVNLKSVTTGQLTSYLFIVDHNNAVSMSKYKLVFSELIKNAYNLPANRRGGAWKEFYAFKNSNLLLKTMYYDNGKVMVTKDLDYSYALTVHKTQGSTYDNIVVNVNNILSYGDNSKAGRKFRNQLLYVACSRAHNKVTMLI